MPTIISPDSQSVRDAFTTGKSPASRLSYDNCISMQLQGGEGAVAAVACVALALQVGEGFYWDALGDYGMATTQLRLMSTARI